MTEPDQPGGPVRQDNAAHDGGTQNITHGGNVINNNYSKGHRVQSSARVAGESASDTEVGDAKLGLGWAFEINTDGTVTKAP
ncbi:MULTISPECIES: hypothetical protein [unclassified Streptomyces]|uniref:hypothetical protein n=1 Tax=unclassified Streptomyces TaxID=2593676 RepID=UPI002E119887|nr:hypothetical protein OG299_17615 [Streptomyces sp. NBC_01296]WSW61217.1 hypothetical protein OG513_23035 [Streptomyces sp. NBC_00998]